MVLKSLLVSALAPSVDALNNWEGVSVPGATCSDGSAYSFAFRKGTVDNLVIEFEGGGACWNAATCALGTFSKSVNINSKINSLNRNVGVHADRSDNPTANWNYVYVPYCTGDIFLGHNIKHYGLFAGTVHHTGGANTEKVMDWVYKNVESPQKVVTTGCSAGSIGMMVWAPTIMKHYERSEHEFFGDSFVGVLTPSQWADGRTNWKMEESFPLFIPGMKEIAEGPYRENLGSELLLKAADYFPRSRFAQFTYNADAVQSAFYVLGGGLRGWTGLMRGEIDFMAKAPQTNVHWYIASGASHCSITGNGFYNVKSDSVLLPTFYDELVDRSKSALRNVDCAADGECSSRDSLAQNMTDSKDKQLAEQIIMNWLNSTAL